MIRLSVPDMSCGHCKASVEQAVTRLDPQATVAVDLGTRSVTVTSGSDVAAIIGALAAAGFPATPVS